MSRGFAPSEAAGTFFLFVVESIVVKKVYHLPRKINAHPTSSVHGFYKLRKKTFTQGVKLHVLSFPPRGLFFILIILVVDPFKTKNIYHNSVGRVIVINPWTHMSGR